MPRKSTNNQNEASQLIGRVRQLLPGDAEKALALLDEALDGSSVRDIGRSQLLGERAAILLRLGRHKQAIDGLESARSILEAEDDAEGMAHCDETLGEIYRQLGNNEDALAKLLEVLSFWKERNDIEATAQVYGQLAKLHKSLSEYNKAIEQYHQALRLYESAGDKRAVCVSNYHIGNCYQWAGELDMARNYLDKALTEAQVIGDPLLKIRPMVGLAGLHTQEEQFVKALGLLNTCLDMLDITGDENLKTEILQNLGHLYLRIRQPDKAIEKLEKALDIAGPRQHRFPANVIHDYLAQAFETVGDHEKALTHLRASVEITNAIRQDESALKTTGLQIKYDLDELRNEKESAERKSKLNNQFLSGISHELRTSLNGIEGMVNLLAETHPSPEQFEYINTIRLSASNLLVIVSDLFDFSRIHEGIDFDKQEFNLKEQLTALIQMFKTKTDEKSLKLILQLDRNLPDRIVGDPLRLNQILHNLLNNAVKFTKEGSVSLHVQMLESADGRVRLLFQVTDSGIGISAKQLPYVFEKFANPEVFDGNKEGTGIGLSLVKNLVERQGGTVTVTSRLKKGSVFNVELEYAVAKGPEHHPEAKGKRNVHPLDFSNTRVLLVEDNKVNQFLAKQLLSKMGFNVTIAGNAESAIDQLKEADFDIILMDVQMPGMSGYELSRYIKEKLSLPQSAIPIIAITANVSDNEKETAIAAGMVDYIPKPYSPQELLAVIMKHVQAKKANDEDPVTGLLDMMGGSHADLVELIEVFVDQTPAMNGELHKQLQAGNWKKAHHTAHKLKSSLRILKSDKLNELISKIDDNTSEVKNLNSLEGLFSEYSALCDAFVGKLKASLPKLRK